MTTNNHLWSHLAQFFLEWEMFQTNGVEKSKHRFRVHIYFFRKFCNLWDNVEKYCTDGQATDDNMVHVHWMLDT